MLETITHEPQPLPGNQSYDYDPLKLNEIRNRVDQIDLGPVRFKLVKEQGWSDEKLDEVEVLYRGFLTLIGLFEGKSFVPTKDIDEMWHTHILDTKKYFEDCYKTFGRYIHHFPFLGMRGKEDQENANASFKQTRYCFKDILDLHLTAKSEAGCVGTECNMCDGGGCDSGPHIPDPAPKPDLDLESSNWWQSVTPASDRQERPGASNNK